MTYPSIFNDVVGPVMRGPSSSHCAASLRIGRICHDLMGGKISEIEIDFDTHGSLATTHKDQGSDMGLFGGFLGWEAHDERLVDAESHIRAARIPVKINIIDFQAEHPNTYRITLKNPWETHQMVALSTGGGMIEVIEIDKTEVSLAGDSFVTLIYTEDPDKVSQYLKRSTTVDGFQTHPGAACFVLVTTRVPMEEPILQELGQLEAGRIAALTPQVPEEIRPLVEEVNRLLQLLDGTVVRTQQPHADRREVRGHGSSRAAAGAARVAARVVRISGLAAERADRLDAARELVQVGFADEDGAGFAQPAHLRAVIRRYEPGHRDRAGRCRHVVRVVVVFQHDRYAVQRSARALFFALAVELGGLFECAGVDRDHRIEARPVAVERSDAVEVLLHERRGRCLS